MARKPAPIHPGEILLEESLEPMEITQYGLAKEIDLPERRINEIVHGNRGTSADTALRVSKCFGTTPRFRMNLQIRHRLEVEKNRLGSGLDEEMRKLAAG